MKSKKVIRYYADCGKGFWSKSSCLYHEKTCKCWKNPKNRTCKTCKWAEEQFKQVDEEICNAMSMAGENIITAAGYKCTSPYNNFEHSGGPEGITHLSVNCVFYNNISNDS